ncbi:MAG TPA: tRNA lysidine(34) synthetase TilS [Telluria sp.]|nr:tRNA lysidine(34) synthetase TilS [Telluria sp.]
MIPRQGEGGAAALPGIFTRSLDALRAQHAPAHLAVAYSGGLDSTVLLHLAARYCAQAGVRLSVFHVHHGLSANADAWLAHCAQAAAALQLPFHAQRVAVNAAGKGTEAAARAARYAALGGLCGAHGADMLLTAHHLDDQAETVLLQLLRGSGPAGMAGMERCHRAAGLLGAADVWLARPLLDATRAQLEAWATADGLAWVEDESNAETRYTRNALRHGAMPELARVFPGYQQRLARAAAHAQSAQRLLDELADQDLRVGLGEDGALDCAWLRGLSEDRANNALRRWFHARGLQMPSTAWLAELLAQAVSAREDAQLRVTHPACELRRHRDRLHIVPRRSTEEPASVTLSWQGESALAVPAFGGTLHIEKAEQGIDPAWLRTHALTVAARRGSALLKLAANRPSRSLKHHYQASAIPPWERERLPVVYAGNAVLYAAGLGMDYRFLNAFPGVVLRWSFDA